MATDAAPEGQRISSHHWGWFMLRGVLAILLGIGALFFPLSALFAFTLMFAAYAFIDGVLSLAAGIRGAEAHQRWGSLVLRGVTGILVGVIFMFMPIVATVTYAYLGIVLLAIWSVFAGLFEIGAAVRLRREVEGEWLLGLSGLFSLLLGVAILVLVIPDPRATILSASWLIAIYAFASGFVLMIQAFSLRRKAAR